MPILPKREGESESERDVRSHMVDYKKHPKEYPGGRAQAVAIGLNMAREEAEKKKSITKASAFDSMNQHVNAVASSGHSSFNPKVHHQLASAAMDFAGSRKLSPAGHAQAAAHHAKMGASLPVGSNKIGHQALAHAHGIHASRPMHTSMPSIPKPATSIHEQLRSPAPPFVGGRSAAKQALSGAQTMTGKVHKAAKSNFRPSDDKHDESKETAYDEAQEGPHSEIMEEKKLDKSTACKCGEMHPEGFSHMDSLKKYTEKAVSGWDLKQKQIKMAKPKPKLPGAFSGKPKAPMKDQASSQMTLSMDADEEEKGYGSIEWGKSETKKALSSTSGYMPRHSINPTNPYFSNQAGMFRPSQAQSKLAKVYGPEGVAPLVANTLEDVAARDFNRKPNDEVTEKCVVHEITFRKSMGCGPCNIYKSIYCNCGTTLVKSIDGGKYCPSCYQFATKGK